ncbi:MAG: MFS transporter [Anaerolineales bacterium]|nr:MFS transporter [Anaerolineales bacterium]
MTTSAENLRTNARHFVLDIFWFGFLAGSIFIFLPVYITRLDATKFQVGLLTAAPAMVSMLASIPVGKWLEKQDWSRVMVSSNFWQRVIYALVLFLPFLPSRQMQVWAGILIVLAASFPTVAASISFNAQFAAAIPADLRSQVVGKRFALMSVSLVISSLGCGWILDHIVFPLNYQVVFLTGIIGSIISTYHLTRIHSTAPQEIQGITTPVIGYFRENFIKAGNLLRQEQGMRYLIQEKSYTLLRLDLLRTPFGGFAIGVFIVFTFLYLAVPLFPVFFVQDLALTDGWISIGNAINQAAIFISSILLFRISEKVPHRTVTVVAFTLIGFQAIVFSFTYTVPFYLIMMAFGGSIWGLCNGGVTDRLMEIVPENDRPAHMALYNVLTNFGMMLGSLLGPLVGTWLGVRTGILIAGGLRVIGGGLLGLLDKKPPPGVDKPALITGE